MGKKLAQDKLLEILNERGGKDQEGDERRIERRREERK